MECLGLNNKPKAEVHPGHKLTGPKEEEEEEKGSTVILMNFQIATLTRIFNIVAVQKMEPR
jgi:hypothetical protein